MIVEFFLHRKLLFSSMQNVSGNFKTGKYYRLQLSLGRFLLDKDLSYFQGSKS